MASTRPHRAALGSVGWLRCGLFLCLAGSQLWAQSDAGREAKQDLTDGRYTEAEAIYRKLLRTEPNSEQLLTNLGISLSLQGRSEEAETQFRHTEDVCSANQIEM